MLSPTLRWDNYVLVVHGVFATTVEVKVFDRTAQSGPNAKLSASKFPKQTEETPQLLGRMLQLLATQAVLDCSFVEFDNSRSFGLNSTADESGINLAPTVLWGHAISENPGWIQFAAAQSPLLEVMDCGINICYSLKDAVLEGVMSFNKANNGLNMFDILRKSPDLNEIFNQAMCNRSALIMREVLQVYRSFNDANV